MMPTEIVTAVQEGIKIIIVLVDNQGICQHRRPEPRARAGRIRDQLSCAIAQLQASWMAIACRWTMPPMSAVLARTPSRPTSLDELKKALEEAKSY